MAVFFHTCILAVALVCLNGCATGKKSCCGSCCAGPAGPAASEAVCAPPSTNESPWALPGEWEDETGGHLNLAELKGQTVLISMFYASCEGICVITRNDMLAVEAALSPAAREHTTFVLVTLAPELDTPAVLTAYRTENGLAAGHWRLLRGSPAATAALAARLGVRYGKDPSGLFRHASQLTVVGAAGNILWQQDGVHADLTATARIINSAANPPVWSAQVDPAF